MLPEFIVKFAVIYYNMACKRPDTNSLELIHYLRDHSNLSESESDWKM